MFPADLKTALLIVWLLVSLLIFPVLAAPFLVPPDSLLSLAPACEWKVKYNRECPLCGMTTAFILISDGCLNQAVEANRGSVPLYSALLWNQFVALWYVFGQFRLRRAGTAPYAHRQLETEEYSCKS